MSGDERRASGVVHTPPELARHVAAAADERLRACGILGGLSDPATLVVDPACGAGAFVAAALGVCAGRASKPAAVWACDRDRQAVAVARRVAGPELGAAGWQTTWIHADTLGVDPEPVAGGHRVVAVIGNPPWSTAAAGQAVVAPAFQPMLDDFRRLPDGQPLRERKLGVLSDRYVSFMRWAFAVAACAKHVGVVALVTNGSFVDGPVHRAMRAAMEGWSCSLEIVDLGGNALLSRAGKRDDNVFGVRPSVAITLAVCGPRAGQRPTTYRRLWGTRADKWAALGTWAAGDREGSSTVTPRAPAYAFVPVSGRAHRYAEHVPLSDLFPFHREGVQTNRDAAVVASERGALLARLRAFVAGTADAALDAARTPSRHYDPERARTAVATALSRDPDGRLGISVLPIAYRRADSRVFCPVTPFCHRPRPRLLAAMAHSEFALVSVRKDRGDRPWQHIAAVRVVADSSFLSNRSSCRTRVFPVCDPHGRDNLDPVPAAAIARVAGRPVSAADVARYAISVLSAPAYQARFDGFLRTDYARVPMPEDRERFWALVDAAEQVLAGDARAGSTSRFDELLDPTWLR